MGLFDTLIHPDREERENAERMVVIDAANRIQVGEFQLLQLAYRDGHGEDLPDALVDRLFTAYMLRDEVPAWARQYARRIIALDRAGRLDDTDPAFHRYDPPTGPAIVWKASPFWRAVIIVAALLGGVVLLALLDAGESPSVLPPFFEEKELRLRGDRPNRGESGLGRYDQP